MDEGHREVRWALASFHAALLMLLALGLAAWLADAGFGAFASVGTLAGAAAYVLLWVLAWVAARGTLAGSRLTPDGPGDARGELLSAAMVWGSVAAAAFVAIAGTAAALLAGQPGGLIVVAIASVAAALVGAIVGLLLGLLDALLLRAAVALLG